MFFSFQCISLSPFWLKFIPGYFVFDAAVTGIVFLISFWDWSLLVYKDTIRLKCCKFSLQKGTGYREYSMGEDGGRRKR